MTQSGLHGMRGRTMDRKRTESVISSTPGGRRVSVVCGVVRSEVCSEVCSVICIVIDQEGDQG